MKLKRAIRSGQGRTSLCMDAMVFDSTSVLGH